jgi:hypothetical protein
MGDIFEAGANESLKFGASWLSLNPATIQGKELILNLSLYLMDKVTRNESNENEVLSDQLEIGRDILALLEDVADDSDWALVRGSSIDFFTEAFDDEVAGVKIDLSIKVPNIYDSCQVPTNG